MSRGGRFSDFRPIVARFASKASRCSHEIARGDRIGYSARHGTFCQACWARWEAENEAAAFDERMMGCEPRAEYVAEPCRLTYEPRAATIRGPENAVEEFWRSLAPGEMREHFVALYLSSRNEVIGEPYAVSVGSLNASLVHPREVYRPAIERAAASLILVHNHPSGDPTPSEEDLAITRRLREVGNMLGITLLDHIVTGRVGLYVSLKEQGVLRA